MNNSVQQKKNTYSETLHKQLMNCKIQSQTYSTNDMEIPKLVVPKNKEELRTSVCVIKEALNKANKLGIDLETAASLRDLTLLLNKLVECSIMISYIDKTQQIQFQKIEFPTTEQLLGMWTLLTKVTEHAQVAGAYETIEESGKLYDSLLIIGRLLGSIIGFVDSKEQNQNKEQSLHDEKL